MIGKETEPVQPNTEIVWEDIPTWSRSSLRQHATKVEEQLKLLQQGREHEAQVYVGNNCQRRGGISMVTSMLENYLNKLPRITLDRMPSQATELLGTTVVDHAKGYEACNSVREQLQ